MTLIRDIVPRATSAPETWPSVHSYAVVTFAATWPIWRWYVSRMTDGSDEPYGLLALATWAVLVWLAERKTPVRLGWPAALLALYGLAYPFSPPLGRAALALGAVGALLFRGPATAPLWGLAALSLPIVATLQFYAGYPLRALAASVSVLLLRVSGFAVTRDGSMLHWNGETVMVDVPCSGVQMLWCGFYLAFVLSALHQLTPVRTALCTSAAMVLVIAANALRAAILFFKEAHIVDWAEWTHATVGVALFACAAMLLARIAGRLALMRGPAAQPTEPPLAVAYTEALPRPPSLRKIPAGV